MDILILLLCGVFTVGFGLILYFISVSSMKEKTYDEVKAEQKKKAEEYLSQGRSIKEKAKDKKLKKAGKKVKEKINVVEQSEISKEVDSGKGHVAFVDRPIIADKSLVIEDKRKRKNKKKPILLNKNEPVLVAEVPPPVVNHFEKIVPKDDFELKQNHTRDEGINKNADDNIKNVSQPQKSAAPQQSKSQSKSLEQKHEKQPQSKSTSDKTQKNTEKENSNKSVDKGISASTSSISKNIEKKEIVEEKKVTDAVEKTVKTLVKPQSVIFTSGPGENVSASPTIKTSKKKRSELATLQQMSGDREAINVNLLMPLVHKAELSRSEIQVLIDVLLNKQQGSQVGHSEWTEGRQDPMVKLRKQLAEKEKALAEEQEAGVGLQNKLKELRAELNSEKHTSRQLEDSVHARQVEITGLATRLQHSAEEKQALGQQLQQLQAKLTEDHMLLCKLQEEQGQTQSVLQQELLSQRQQLEMHIARLTEQHQETLAAMEAQLGQLAGQLQEKEAINASISGELTMLRERGAHLQDSAAHSQDLARKLKDVHSELERVMTNAQFDSNHLQGEVNSLNEQLNLKRAENEKFNSVIQNLQVETQRLKESNESLNQKVTTAYVEARQLREENESLAAQMTASMERPAAEGRENGDSTYTESRNSSGKQDTFQENEKLIEQLNSEVALRESNIEKFTSEINNYKTESAKQELLVKSLNAEIDRLKAQLSTMDLPQNKEKLMSEINDYKTERAATESLINSLRGDVDKYKLEIKELSQKVSVEDLSKNEERLLNEMSTLKTNLAADKTLIATLNQDIIKYKSNLDATSKEILTKEEEIEQLKKEIKSSEAIRTSLLKDLETQKAKNDELRKKNWKVMEAMSTTENTLKNKLNQIQNLVSESASSAKTEEQLTTRGFLQKSFPDVVIENKMDQMQWLQCFVDAITNAQPSSNLTQDNNEVLAELEKQNSHLQAMVINYKNIIADTERMLNQLQNYVEHEESRWGQKIQALENQLEAVMLERDNLEENSELAAQLESSLNLNKEQSKELARLRSLVQIGQDTFNEEHKQVLSLQQEVADIKAGEDHRTTNGLSKVDDGSGIN